MQEHPLAPLILTLRLEPAAFARLDALRRAHFPPKRNMIPAHITLFHALPGDQVATIHDLLLERCASTAPINVRVAAPRFLGRGVAVEIEAPALIALRRQLASAWAGWLSAQDQQGYRPHCTIQNKVAPDQARELYAALVASWEPFEALGDGLLLWRYLGGPWELVDEYDFSATDSMPFAS